MNADEETIRSQLSAFLDGQLPPEQAETVAAALVENEQLRVELAALEATRNLLRRLPREPAPPQIAQAVMQEVEREHLLSTPHESPPRSPLRWVPALAAAAIIVLTVGLGIYLHGALKSKDWVDQQNSIGGTPLARKLEDVEPPGQPEPNAIGGEWAYAAKGNVNGPATRRALADSADGERARAADDYDSGFATMGRGESAGVEGAHAAKAAPANVAVTAAGTSASPAGPDLHDLPEAEAHARGAKSLDLPLAVARAGKAGPANRYEKGGAPTSAQEALAKVEALAATAGAVEDTLTVRRKPAGTPGLRAKSLGMPPAVARVGKAGDDRSYFAGQLLADVRSVVLNTTDLQRTNARVYAVLAANDIQEFRTERPAPAGAKRRYSRANVAYTKLVSPVSNEIVFYVDADQAPKLVRQIKQIDVGQEGLSRGIAFTADDDKERPRFGDKFPKTAEPVRQAHGSKAGEVMDGSHSMTQLELDEKTPAKPKRPASEEQAERLRLRDVLVALWRKTKLRPTTMPAKKDVAAKDETERADGMEEVKRVRSGPTGQTADVQVAPQGSSPADSVFQGRGAGRQGLGAMPQSGRLARVVVRVNLIPRAWVDRSAATRPAQAAPSTGAPTTGRAATQEAK